MNYPNGSNTAQAPWNESNEIPEGKIALMQELAEDCFYLKGHDQAYDICQWLDDLGKKFDLEFGLIESLNFDVCTETTYEILLDIYEW